MLWLGLAIAIAFLLGVAAGALLLRWAQSLAR